MRKVIYCTSALALFSALSACGSREEAANNVAAENDMNAMTNLEELPPVTPAANVAAEEAVTEMRQPEPAATKPAPATPTPTPAKPKPKPEPAAEPKAPEPTCLPEHRAAGHC